MVSRNFTHAFFTLTMTMILNKQKGETWQLKGKCQSKLLEAGQLLKSALFDDPASRHTRLL
jgi:hypothetical protein